jgi:hypothetical protein
MDWKVIYLHKIQAALVKDPGVSVNRVIWSPDGSLFGKLGPYWSTHGIGDLCTIII